MKSLPLPARLDTAAATALAATLRQRVEAGDPLDLIAADVDLVGLACLQVLASARNTALSNDRDFALNQPSDALRDACGLAGLGYLLEAHQGSPA